MVGHADGMTKIRTAHKILSRKLKEKKSLETSKRRQKGNITIFKWIRRDSAVFHKK
jgi:hypothetical protein